MISVILKRKREKNKQKLLPNMVVFSFKKGFTLKDIYSIIDLSIKMECLM